MKLAIALALAAALAVTSGATSATGKEEGGEAPLKFSGITLVSASGRVELLRPGKPEYKPVGVPPVPLGVGMLLKTGTMSKALLEYEDGGLVSISAHSQVKLSNPACELFEGRIKAAAPPRQLVAVETAAVPVRIEGRSFSVVMPGKGKGKMAALGNGRATAAKLIAFKGFVEVQLPFGTVRAAQLPITLHEGSVVQTAANSFALVLFPDGSRVKLRADSTVAVDNEHRITMAAGAADVLVTEKGKLETRTINRQAVIRGPAFAVQVNPEGETAPPAEDIELPKTSADATVPGGAGWDSSGGR